MYAEIGLTNLEHVIVCFDHLSVVVRWPFVWCVGAPVYVCMHVRMNTSSFEVSYIVKTLLHVHK